MNFSISSIIFIILQVSFLPTSTQQEDYTIIETETGNQLSLAVLADKLTEAEVIFFGEEHNDSIAHVLQYQLYKSLLLKNSSLTLSLEMFERDVQLVMDEYLAGLITEKKLRQEGKIWNNYSAYAPLVNLAKENRQQVIAANVPGRYANMVSRKGLASLDQLQRKARHLFAKIKAQTPTYSNSIKLWGLMHTVWAHRFSMPNCSGTLPWLKASSKHGVKTKKQKYSI